MLGKQSPWSIVYPTLVDVNANQDKHLEELQQILGCLVTSHFYPFSAACHVDNLLSLGIDCESLYHGCSSSAGSMATLVRALLSGFMQDPLC